MNQKGSRRSVRTFAWASFLNDLGAYMVLPVWPLFVTTFLGANMAVLGLVDGLGDAVVSISQALSGYVSDRIRRRKAFIWIGYIFGALSRLGYSISTSWPALVPFRILDRGGKMRDAPRDAIVADLSKRQNRGRNFGFLKAMDKFGAVCGVLATLFLFDRFGFKNFFLLASIPSALGALLVFYFIKEKKFDHNKLYKGISFRDISPNFKLFLFVSSLFALGSFSYSFLLVYAKSFGFGTKAVPILFLIFTAFAASSSLPFGKLADRIGRKKVIEISLFLWVSVCLIFLFLKSYLLIAVAFILYGLHKGALDTAQKVFVAELSPKGFRASVLGGFEMVIGVCAFPASLMAGLLWDKIGMEIPLYFSFGLTVLAMILLIFVKEKKND